MFLTSVQISGYPVDIGDAAITALLGYGVVFFGLFLLMLVVIAMGKIMQSTTGQKTEAPAAPAAPVVPVAAATVAAPSNVPAPGTAGEILLVDTTEKEAACIMAIVADKMGKPLNELRFISIKKEVK